mmetsp:Transcript_18416/g.46852  ORF Transcript_18416/g.46852 Transcript_18416/m.46852 type:complete len:94 (-) Transcript_18416:63-344(-)
MAAIGEGDLESVPGQIGTLVLEHSGRVLSATGELESMGNEVASTVLAMLRDSKPLVDAFEKGNSFHRMTVGFSKYAYVITMSTDRILVVKKVL